MTLPTTEHGFPLPTDQSKIRQLPWHLRNLSYKLEEYIPQAVTVATRAYLPSAVTTITTAIRVTAENALSVARAATDAATSATSRVAALESSYGLGPASPTDGTVADLVAQPETLTAAAVDESVAGLVSGTTSTTAAALSDTLASVGPWLSGGDFQAPRIVREVELLRDPDGRLKDGAAWLTTLYVADKPGTWLDNWYGYVSGHDSTAIWLVTAPDLLGPWTFREAVVGIRGSGARMEEPLVAAHTSSPHALWQGSELRLYFHGPKAANGLEQPTFMATSSDGRAFTSRGIVLDTEWNNSGSPYRTSISYVTTAAYAGRRHAVWQGTTGRNATFNGVSYAPMPVGYATSVDGKTWRKQHPILPSLPGDQGLLAPGLVRLSAGWMLVGTYRSADGAGGQLLTVACFYGPTLDTLRRVGNIGLPQSGRTQEIVTPQFHEHQGRLWMIGGVRPPGSTVRTVTAFELEWN